ncbi:hypothetical protein NEUTE1DRAFT_126758 [Neurospora tetrasperma FGSC 2508]|uniref:Uncharacterized protein n=1 Tax=Neurospora tetrasperma (strain FGSC 2508 / ATCC MYA-4615 / P0657) TaxID=510951 RepID=F8N3Q6_NEUT8|nr:uncharacterized protein NEUTE1DRAFT_126758 [Neurospora tetrasperma FGSC 2508]EGO53457.1 hypothetical protein NEUTE1DRAFT_126758 [Neurospora tetrasperma FGSC 2508]
MVMDDADECRRLSRTDHHVCSVHRVHMYSTPEVDSRYNIPTSVTVPSKLRFWLEPGLRARSDAQSGRRLGVDNYRMIST